MSFLPTLNDGRNNVTAYKSDGSNEAETEMDTSCESLRREEGPMPMSVPTRLSLEARVTTKETETTEDRKKTPQPSLDWSFMKRGQLFGRQQEVKDLTQAFYRRINTDPNLDKRPEFLLVSGSSGCGKSMLVKTTLQDLARQSNGFFTMGKFDQMRISHPYGPFATALTQLVVAIETDTSNKGEQRMRHLRNSLVSQVGLDSCHVLCALVPEFSRLLGLQDEGDPVSLKTHDAQQNRLTIALTKFIKAFCSPKMPLICCLDDLQWADCGSLSLLEALASNSNLDGFVLVGVCRQNEVSVQHNFASTLRRLEDEKETHIFHLEVDALDIEATNALLSTVLRQPIDMCLPLAKIVNEKSFGNIFFMIQLIKALNEEGVLVAEEVEEGIYQWFWHEDRWSLSFEHDIDVVELVSNQMQRLPASCQRLLKIAACSGVEFELDMVATLLGESDTHVSELLSIVMEEQLVTDQHRPGIFSFAHDLTQQAAYLLIHQDLREHEHLSIGRSLLQELSSTELEQHLFLVVDQLSRGFSLLTNEVDKTLLAELCVQAGKKASRASDFVTALTYFEFGSNLLPTRYWRDEYHLSLDLFSSRAETECCSARFQDMEKSIDQVLENGRTANDKLRAYLTKIYSLGARAHFKEAIDLGLEVMSTLGEKFPKPRLVNLIPEFLRVKGLLASKSDADILHLPTIDVNDRNKMAVMSVIHLLQVYCFCSNPQLLPFVVFRCLKLTLRYGLCELSCLAFASYGVILCAVDQSAEGYRYGQLGLLLFERCKYSRAQLFPRLYFIFYGMLAPWKKSIKSTLDPLHLAITSSTESGDFECSMFSSYTFIVHCLAAGDRLSKVDERLSQYIEIMAPRQGPWLALTLLVQNFVHNFTGKTNDPLLLNCEMDATNKAKHEFELYEYVAVTLRLELAYHFGDLELALASARAARSGADTQKTTFMVMYVHLFDALTALEAAHHGKRLRRLRRARKILKKFERLAKQCPENILHKLYLIKGDMQALYGNLDEALCWYEQAKDRAASVGILCLQGIACERAAIAYERLGKGSADSALKSRDYRKKALHIYEQ